MIQRKVNLTVPVATYIDHKTKKLSPIALIWSGRKHILRPTDLPYDFKDGNILHQVFCVASDTLYFKLDLDTKNLIWKVMEVADDIPD